MAKHLEYLRCGLRHQNDIQTGGTFQIGVASQQQSRGDDRLTKFVSF